MEDSGRGVRLSHATGMYAIRICMATPAPTTQVLVLRRGTFVFVGVLARTSPLVDSQSPCLRGSTLGATSLV